MCIVHYTGSLKTVKNFIDNKKTTKTTFTKLENHLNTTNNIKSNKRIFFDFNSKISKDNNESTNKNLINSRQIADKKYRMLKEIKISNDNISNVRYLKAIGLDDYIRYIRCDKVIEIFLAHPGCVELSKRLIKNFKDTHLLEIDLTYEVCEFYVTQIVMKNKEILNEPGFPISHFIHQSKSDDTFLNFFEYCQRERIIDFKLNNIALVSDKEPGN